ncbi:MAG: ABC transporter ATP-binding protein [Planctomycetota bacterium]|jgi:putative ABC transport system ATP-binding protein|nr:ABC transporter ATP-binding protein [Planctomycetota bacterium]
MSEPAIRAVDLTRSYENGLVEAVTGVSVHVASGEFVAIMGPSGSGKSTFLNCVGTLDWPTSGQVFLDGEEVINGPHVHRLRRRKIGFVFQFHNLIPNLTLAENLQIPLSGAAMTRKEKRERALYLLDRVGLGPRARHRANRVSGGERQRAAIARALVNNPSILLADEPTGNLDSANGRVALDLLLELRRDAGMTMVVVTHNPEVARSADRVFEFRDGRIV